MQLLIVRAEECFEEQYEEKIIGDGILADLLMHDGR